MSEAEDDALAPPADMIDDILRQSDSEVEEEFEAESKRQDHLSQVLQDADKEVQSQVLAHARLKQSIAGRASRMISVKDIAIPAPVEVEISMQTSLAAILGNSKEDEDEEDLKEEVKDSVQNSMRVSRLLLEDDHDDDFDYTTTDLAKLEANEVDAHISKASNFQKNEAQLLAPQSLVRSQFDVEEIIRTKSENRSKTADVFISNYLISI